MKFRGGGTPKVTTKHSSEVLFLIEEAAKAGAFTAVLWRAKIECLGLYHAAGARDADTLRTDRFQAHDFLHHVARNGSPLTRYRVGLLYLNDKKRESEASSAPKPPRLPARELLDKALEEGVTEAAAPLAQIAAQLRK
jgi:hypothetical protein